MSDVFFGEPGLSAPKYEVDFAPRKPRCDLLLNATAYAPEGRTAEHVTVGVRIGTRGSIMCFTKKGEREDLTARAR
jgi:hypothetical protein